MKDGAETLGLKKKYILDAGDLISIQDLARKTDVPIRKVRYYMTHGAIRKTIRRGRDSYYERAYVFNALDCLAILEEVFLLPLREFKQIMVANDSSIKKLHEKIEAMLDKYPPAGKRPVHYSLIEAKFLEYIAAGNLDFDIDALEKQAAGECGGK